MWIGNLNGRERVYDENGQLILKQGEQILFKMPNSHALDVSTSWRSFFFETAYNANAGDGNLYITNQRIIHIREADPYKASKEYITETDMTYGIEKALIARDVKRGGGREFCEIIWNDIIKVKKTRWGIILYIIHEGEKYHASILSKDGAKIIEHFIPKTESK